MARLGGVRRGRRGGRRHGRLGNDTEVVGARADLTLADLPSGGYREVQARSGNDLDPGDRLHLCGAAVPPATGRIAGHRRAYLGPGRRRVRTEVAVYADGGAARALDALRALAPRCS